jgi:hypothetical protein
MSSPSPRLLSVKAAAAYMGISSWVMWGWIKAGVLPSVVPPSVPSKKRTTPGDLRRLLIDRLDLDELISRWKRHA